MTVSDKPKRVDKRVLRTRKAIMAAFDKLISKGDINKITVSAIAREADIDRKTFYLHYRSIDDLANCKTEEGIERILATLKADGEGKAHLERVHIVLGEVNSILTENIAAYANIASRLSTDQVLKRFEEAAAPAFRSVGLNPEVTADQHVHMQLQFFIAGALSLYSSWLKSDRKEPIETVSEAIENAIRASYLLANSRQSPPPGFESASKAPATHPAGS